jgi:dienelactone hydrolase
VLRDWGYATFALDSFTGRKLREVCSDATVLSGIQRIPDAYGALRLLATHPRIDARRAALMGFSHGGILTLNAATLWAKETYVPAGQPAFRAFLPFYPYCNTVYPERDHVSAPLRIHIAPAAVMSVELRGAAAAYAGSELVWLTLTSRPFAVLQPPS